MIFKKPRDINQLLSDYPDKLNTFSKKELSILLEYAFTNMYIINEKYNKLLLNHEKLKDNINYDKIRFLYKTKYKK